MLHKENQDIGLARRIPSKPGRLSIPTLGMAETPETSDHASIKERLSPRFDLIPFSLNDYLELVDFTGRIIHPNKRGHIPEHRPPSLKRLELSIKLWIAEATEFEDRYHDKSPRPSGPTTISGLT